MELSRAEIAKSASQLGAYLQAVAVEQFPENRIIVSIQVVRNKIRAHENDGDDYSPNTHCGTVFIPTFSDSGMII
jgi:hypothetical protein